MSAFTAVPSLLVLLLLAGLFWKARPILLLKSLPSILLSSAWAPLRGQFGLLSFVVGTLWVTAIALVVALPISLFTAIYLSEYAARSIREIAKPVVDLLAGLPSVIFGVWGVLSIVPLVRGLGALLGVPTSGYSVLAGGLVLAVMVFPTIISVSLEVFGAIPQSLRDASLSLGATRWETVRHVVLRKGGQGILAAGVLGLSRAFGETIAVLMVVGNVPVVTTSPFGPGYPLPALIANNYGEMMSIPLYDSALMLAALALLVVVVIFGASARVILARAERRAR